MAGTGRFNITGDGMLESAGGPGLFWYTRAAFADFVLCVDWRLSSFEDNSVVYLRFPPLRRDDPECDWRTVRAMRCRSTIVVTIPNRSPSIALCI
jgi:hypothetical protein